MPWSAGYATISEENSPGSRITRASGARRSRTPLRGRSNLRAKGWNVPSAAQFDNFWKRTCGRSSCQKSLSGSNLAVTDAGEYQVRRDIHRCNATGQMQLRSVQARQAHHVGAGRRWPGATTLFDRLKHSASATKEPDR